jgi:pimeloyl-ACP methyl ester carboxylesterase
VSGPRRHAVRANSRTAPAATIGGVRTRILETDGSGPTVLLVHGYSDSADGWRDVMDRLATAGLHSVAVDLPHHGRAGRPPVISFLAVLDDFVAAAVQKFDDGDGVVLVGNSVGGLSALRVAQRADLPLRAVLALGPAGLSAPLWMKLLRRAHPVTSRLVEGANVPILRGTNVVPALLASGFARAVAGGKLSPTAKAQYASHWGPGDLRRQLLLGGQTVEELLRPDVLEPRAFQVPVTVAWGDRDWITPGRGASAFGRSHPDTTTRILAGTGHCPQYDRPDLVTDLIVDIHSAAARRRLLKEEMI